MIQHVVDLPLSSVVHMAGPTVQAPGAPGVPAFAPPQPVRTSSAGAPGTAFRPPAPGAGATTHFAALSRDVI